MPDHEGGGDRPRPWSHALWYLLPLLAVTLSYLTVLVGGFVWDDRPLIVESPLVIGDAPISKHFSSPFWGNGGFAGRAFYRPLVSLSYALDFRLWGEWAGGFHLTNLLLHLVCTVLVLRLCRRAGAGMAAAGLLATAFGLAPRLTESVAWISGRTDLLAGLGVLGGLLLYAGPPAPWWRRAGAGVALLGALLCKEIALAGCAAVLVMVWLEQPLPRRVWAFVRGAAPVVAAVAVYGLLRRAAMTGQSLDGTRAARPALHALALATEAVARYAWMLLDPFQPRLQIGNVYHPNPWLSLLGGVILIVAMVCLRRCSRGWTPWQWIAVALGGTALLMVLHIVRLDLNVVAADRFLYLPLAAVAIGCAGPLERLWQKRKRWVRGCALLLLPALALPTTLRAGTWSNEIALWREEVRLSSAKTFVPLTQLSMCLLRRGRFDEALALLDRLPQDDRIPLRYRNEARLVRATCLARVGRVTEAISALQLITLTGPDNLPAQVNLMLAWAQAGRFDEALQLAARLRQTSHEPAVERAVARVQRLGQAWASLPPPSNDEAVATQARRAEVLAELGDVAAAQLAWARLALDPRSEPDLVLQGARYVVQLGTAQAGRQLLVELGRRRLLGAQLEALASALAARFSDD